MTTRERLAITALVSLALHALAISGTWFPVAQPPGAPRPLQARLAPPPPEIKPALAQPKVQAPRRAAPPPVPTVAASSPFALPEPQPDAASAETVAAQPAAPEPPQQVALAAESSAIEAARSLPRRGRISYTLLYGNDRSPVGKAVQSWEVEGGSYTLASDAETTGIVELFRPQRLRYMSQGRITPQGLRPESFLISRSRRGQTEAAQARFDWNGGSLTYGHVRERKSAALSAGTQDSMSFIYQFALAPPAPGRYRVPITTGSRFETYEIEVLDEEYIETPLGVLRALPVKLLARAGAERIEVWLAAEYRYLPVKVRHYDREGNFSGEQIANEIRVSED